MPTRQHSHHAPGPVPAPGASDGSRRRRRAPRAWLAALPLLVFAGICFGLPVGAVLYGAFTATDPATGATSATGANLTTSLQGPYLTSLSGSVELSALTAVDRHRRSACSSRRPSSPPAGGALRDAVLTASGVLANFGGVPLAFAFIATLGISGVVTTAGRPRLPRAGTSTPSPG